MYEYDLINERISVVLQRPDLVEHVTEYDWLVDNLDRVTTDPFQKRYRNYWRMNAAHLSKEYCNVYFQSLHQALTNLPSIGDLAIALHNTPTNKNGRKSLQFSFVTKLVHMINRQSPIYDSLVKKFYLFSGPKSGSLQQKIDELAGFHSFLCQEYAKIIKNGLLTKSIKAFREKFIPKHFTDEKVIDSLIWAYSALPNSIK
ncbi:MAG: hypothetical protein HZA49_01350 [Planctomycetes bacterium]|nr:hypothetical protein [Planctomycetota bacterium]